MAQDGLGTSLAHIPSDGNSSVNSGADSDGHSCSCRSLSDGSKLVRAGSLRSDINGTQAFDKNVSRQDLTSVMTADMQRLRDRLYKEREGAREKDRESGREIEEKEMWYPFRIVQILPVPGKEGVTERIKNELYCKDYCQAIVIINGTAESFPLRPTSIDTELMEQLYAKDVARSVYEAQLIVYCHTDRVKKAYTKWLQEQSWNKDLVSLCSSIEEMEQALLKPRVRTQKQQKMEDPGVKDSGPPAHKKQKTDK
uniref:Uncharacterized protein n=1 Tax=Eutreptiella gymnastica TaxID=73025 RepID=A0A7S1NNW3_9EUGL|mmetsp:Transcript_58571/g.104476  ORF Transcript_58571/g.104476 Transcript_58571/m.104476 type:complete len:254 (-) Transcript_58571:60-821(-)